MTDIRGAWVKNYKAFGDVQAGFDQLFPINVVIGRNNSGKSALLDLIGHLCTPSLNALAQMGHFGREPEALVGVQVTQEDVFALVEENRRSGPGVPDGMGLHRNHYNPLINTVMVLRQESSKIKFASAEVPVLGDYPDHFAQRLGNPLNGRLFLRLRAERDVSSEPSRVLDPSSTIDGNGNGLTNLINHVLNDVGANEELVTTEMLEALNEVCKGVATFSRIEAKRIRNTDNQWEIYLEEGGKGLIPLSSSGSGLQTILLVLGQLLLLPGYLRRDISTCVFAFEELENNLHPGLQRSLLSFVRNKIVDNSGVLFLTTHSNVVIDLFGSDPCAQIVHVRHDGVTACVDMVLTHSERTGVLDDLDFRASDLLQANGIIWVEGPSDRTYLNRWIELRFAGAFREGRDYQCMFYGGRLLARVTADPGNQEALNLLKINRHCALIMDRDTAVINETKQRMRAEVTAVGGFTWTTPKKEIECSIPIGALRRFYSRDDLSEIDGDLVAFDSYLSAVIGEAESRRFKDNKVLFAEQISPLMTVEMIDSSPELAGMLDELGQQVLDWSSHPMALSG